MVKNIHTTFRAADILPFLMVYVNKKQVGYDFTILYVWSENG